MKLDYLLVNFHGRLTMTLDPNPVTLREINADNVIAIVKLTVADEQKGFVASNAVSLAQALFAPEAWYRAVYLGGEPAGFVMLEDQSLLQPPPAEPAGSVRRFMIDTRFQRRGVGRAALSLVIEHVRAKGGFSTLELSYVPGPGCPEPFYSRMGFVPTGRVDGNEVVMALPLDAVPTRAEGPAALYIPPGFNTVTPYCFVNGAQAFVDFLLNGLGGVETCRTMRPDGHIANAQVRLGTSTLMVSEAAANYPAMAGSYYLYVADADAAMARALSHGAKLEMAVSDMPYGDRQGGVRDAYGNIWWISQRLVHEPYSP